MGEQDSRTSGKLIGFARMDPDKRRKVGAQGGRVAHAAGNAHEWDSEAARRAGRKGARKRQENREKVDG